MHSRPPAVTGLGLCTPLGDSLPATWQAILAGKFITDHSQAVGEYHDPRVCSLAISAARQAIAHAAWNTGDLKNAALVVGTSKGTIESWLTGRVDPTGLAQVAVATAHALGIEGPRLTLSTACASSLHALIRGAMLLREGYDRVLVVATESSLHPLFIGSFARLGVLAPPAIGCRPFDENRAGFLVSEAAAAVCLEIRDDAIHIENFAMLGDARHLTHGDPTGKTLRRLIQSVLAGRGVDLIHAHGTGTPANDSVELAAIQSAHPGPVPPVLYSHKSALGHTLGTAGLISIILNCLCHQESIVPPNARTTHPIPMNGLRFPTQPLAQPIRRSLVIASGFGGAGAAVTLA